METAGIPSWPKVLEPQVKKRWVVSQTRRVVAPKRNDANRLAVEVIEWHRHDNRARLASPETELALCRLAPHVKLASVSQRGRRVLGAYDAQNRHFCKCVHFFREPHRLLAARVLEPVPEAAVDALAIGEDVTVALPRGRLLDHLGGDVVEVLGLRLDRKHHRPVRDLLEARLGRVARPRRRAVARDHGQRAAHVRCADHAHVRVSAVQTHNALDGMKRLKHVRFGALFVPPHANGQWLGGTSGKDSRCLTLRTRC